MKLQKAGLLLLLTLFIGLGFAGCSSDRDYYTKHAKLNIEPLGDWTAIDGTFGFYYDVFREDIVGLNQWELNNIIDIRMQTSELWIESANFRNGDRINLYLESDETGEFGVTLYASGGRPGEGAFAYINEKDLGYARFMDNLIDRLVRFGEVRLWVNGETEWQNTKVFLTIENNLRVDINE